MIVIIFPPGAYGTTVEAVLRSLTVEFNDQLVDLRPMASGSMHGMQRLHRIISTSDDVRFSSPPPTEILQVHYPTNDIDSEVLHVVLARCSPKSVIWVYPEDDRASELIMLNIQYKVAYGIVGHRESLFALASECVTKWNENYTSVADMQRWELRELLSQYYYVAFHGWNTANSLPSNTLSVPMNDLLSSTVSTLKRIISFTGLTLLDEDRLCEFADRWRTAQQYIVDEHALAINIVESALSGNTDLVWDRSQLSLVSEVIIQKRLRDAGYEIRCYGLNEFPDNTKTLVSLLEKSI